MRADHAATCALGIAVLGGACLACRAAAAEPIPINLSVQYQRIESMGQTQEFWSRNMDMSYARRLSPSLQLASQFRLNMLDYIGRPERSQTPYGSLQLAHTNAGFNASYRPSSSTSGEDITTRQKEAQFTGFVAPPLLPRLDVQWTQRRQEPGSRYPAGTGTTRSGRLSWERGGFELRGGIGDLVNTTDDVGARQVTQRSWDSGLAYRAGQAAWTLHAAVEAGNVRRGVEGGSRDRNLTRGGLFEYSRRLSPRMGANLIYQYRGIEVGGGPVIQSTTTHEGSMTWNLQPTRATQLLVGGGVRPVALRSGITQTLGYLLVSGTAQGRVRAGWTGVASTAQTVNRNPDGHAYWVGSYRAGSRLLLARGLNLDVDGTVTANGDTAARDQRTTTVAAIGVTANPLRRIAIAWNLRGYRAGRDLAHASARSTSQSFDLRWQPVHGIDLGANVARSGALPRGEPTLTTKRYSFRLAPSARFQADLQYAASDQSRQDLANGRLSGREVWSGHAIAGIGRRFRVSAGGAISDPGRSTRSRQADVTLTTRLGGPS